MDFDRVRRLSFYMIADNCIKHISAVSSSGIEYTHRILPQLLRIRYPLKMLFVFVNFIGITTVYKIIHFHN